MNELYAVTDLGGVHKLDGTGRSQDLIAATVGQSEDSVIEIPAQMKTRQYSCGTMDQKKFQNLRLHLKSSDAHVSQGDLSVIVEDPDQTVDMGEIRDEFSGGLAASEDGTLEKRIGNPRGFGAQFQYDHESGRTAIRAAQVKAIQSQGSTTSVS